MPSGRIDRRFVRPYSSGGNRARCGSTRVNHTREDSSCPLALRNARSSRRLVGRGLQTACFRRDSQARPAGLPGERGSAPARSRCSRGHGRRAARRTARDQLPRRRRAVCDLDEGRPFSGGDRSTRTKVGASWTDLSHAVAGGGSLPWGLVSKPIIYEHFGGKEGLYAVVVDREMEYVVRCIAEAIATGSPRSVSSARPWPS